MKVPIEIFKIAQTQVDRAAVRRWLDFLEVSPEFKFPEGETISDPALLVALSGKRCYRSFEIGHNPNVTRIREDWTVYLDNILKSGHGSVIEHATYTFAIENCSRVFTGEMNRHRAGWAISEGSMRFIRYSDGVPYWEPECIQGLDVLDDNQLYRFDCAVHYSELVERVGAEGNSLQLKTPDEKKHATRILMARMFNDQKLWYRALEAVWADELRPESTFKQKKVLTSMFRRGIGMGVATGGVWTGNFRALRHVIAMRASEHAEEEMLHVFSRIAKMMVESEPALFGDFTQTESSAWAPKYPKV